MHKAIEYYLRAGMPTKRHLRDQYFAKGVQDGDSPLRKLPAKLLAKMETSYKAITKQIADDSTRVVAVEQRYRYMAGSSGQIEGVIDALLEVDGGKVVLKEWKTSSSLSPTRLPGYELQARVGVLASMKQNHQTIQSLDIVPLLRPESTISISCDAGFVAETQKQLEQVFRGLRDRQYEPNRGKHCDRCDLKSQCPAWRKG
jgi:CRISPR/Cas system-associated exonuclease Cas4 (RecB family)